MTIIVISIYIIISNLIDLMGLFLLNVIHFNKTTNTLLVYGDINLLSVLFYLY